MRLFGAQKDTQTLTEVHDLLSVAGKTLGRMEVPKTHVRHKIKRIRLKARIARMRHEIRIWKKQLSNPSIQKKFIDTKLEQGLSDRERKVMYEIAREIRANKKSKQKSAKRSDAAKKRHEIERAKKELF
jgi:hypothetical protein